MQSKTWIWVTLLVVVLAAAGFFVWKFVYQPKAEVLPCSTVQVFDLANFSDGPNACLAVGEYPTNEAMGAIANDSIASIKVAPGYKATVYANENFGSGPSAVFTTDLKNLDSVSSAAQGSYAGSWDDIISSIKVETTPICGIAIYNYNDYGSNGSCLPAGNYLAGDLNKTLVPNDTIASIKVFGSFKATVYVNDNFTGNSLEVTSSLANLDLVSGGGETKWDDKISSIKVYDASEPLTCTTVSLYADVNYGAMGAAGCYPVGTYMTANLANGDLGDNLISAIKVSAGYKVTVYDGDNLSGESKEITSDTPDLNTIGWDNRISSVKIEAVSAGSIDLQASESDIESGDSVTLTWTFTGVADASSCTGEPSGWFTASNSTSGSATVTPTEDETYTITCGSVTDSVTVNILSDTTCPAPLSETRTQSCPAGQTGSITQTRVKGASPTCAWGDWTETSDTCTATVATTTTTTTGTTAPTTTTTTATTTSAPASTGPETPLVAGGLLSMALGAFYWIKRRVG